MTDLNENTNGADTVAIETIPMQSEIDNLKEQLGILSKDNDQLKKEINVLQHHKNNFDVLKNSIFRSIESQIVDLIDGRILDEDIDSQITMALADHDISDQVNDAIIDNDLVDRSELEAKLDDQEEPTVTASIPDIKEALTEMIENGDLYAGLVVK